MPPGGIQTHNFSRRAVGDPRLRPRGHWDQPLTVYQLKKHLLYFLQFHLNLDIRTGTMGLRCIIQSSHYPAVPSEDSPTVHQCTMVRNKSYLTQRSAYPTSPNCPSGTNRHSSHSTAISPKLTDGTNPRSAKQQAIAKKMDT